MLTVGVSWGGDAAIAAPHVCRRHPRPM